MLSTSHEHLTTNHFLHSFRLAFVGKGAQKKEQITQIVPEGNLPHHRRCFLVPVKTPLIHHSERVLLLLCILRAFLVVVAALDTIGIEFAGFKTL